MGGGDIFGGLELLYRSFLATIRRRTPGIPTDSRGVDRYAFGRQPVKIHLHRRIDAGHQIPIFPRYPYISFLLLACLNPDIA